MPKMQPDRGDVSRGPHAVVVPFDSGRPMRFSEHYKITKTDADVWFDLVLGQDTMLAADPYLAFDDAQPRWDAVRDKVLEFFRVTHQLAQRTPRTTLRRFWSPCSC